MAHTSTEIKGSSMALKFPFLDPLTGTNGKQENFSKNKSLSSMVVSVLVDGNGIIGPKSTSRIFVVVLIDSVKYVTYSCMLPFK
ncbi:hypothetical protein KY285_020543 [Solanum tuberosum]|nr:hypothetical protein KY285_020543 [Solanum tuberosum]